MKSIIGIDPGLTGALAVLSQEGKIISIDDAPTIVVKTGKKNRTLLVEADMIALLERTLARGAVHAYIENVHAMPGQGVTSMFSMGMGFGLWLGILAALRVPVTRVEPLRWKRGMDIAGGADKGASVVRGLQLFPSCTDLTREYRRGGQVLHTYLHGRADALLIAEWGRRQARK